MKRLSLTLMLVGMAACEPHFDHLELSDVGGRDATTRVSPDGIVLSIESVVAIRIEPVATSEVRDYESFHLVEIEPENPTIVHVYDGPELDVLVFVPQSVGRTEGEIWIRDDYVGSIPIEVKEP